MPLTVCFPPLIKPDGRLSRIRLPESHLRSASSQSALFSNWCGSRVVKITRSDQRVHMSERFPCLRHTHFRSRWAITVPQSRDHLRTSAVQFINMYSTCVDFGGPKRLTRRGRSATGSRAEVMEDTSRSSLCLSSVRLCGAEHLRVKSFWLQLGRARISAVSSSPLLSRIIRPRNVP